MTWPTWRSGTVALLAFFGASAMLLGLLPVRGGLRGSPLGPRPWPAAPTWALALVLIAYFTVNGTYSHAVTSSDHFALKVQFVMGAPRNFIIAIQIAVAAFHGMCRVLEYWERCHRRGALCTLARCLRLYCAAHPLSAAGWRALQLTALCCAAFTWSIFYSGLWWSDPTCSSKDHVNCVLWAVAIVSLHSIAMVPATLTGALSRDLRLACGRALDAATAAAGTTGSSTSSSSTPIPTPDGGEATRISPAGRRAPRSTATPRICERCGRVSAGEIGSPNDALHWRWLRLRHAVLLDMNRMICSITSCQILIMVVCTLSQVAVCAATAVRNLSDVQSALTLNCRLKPVYAAAARLSLTFFSCSAFQRTALEVGRFIHQIVLQDAYFDILGMFRLDISAVKTILAATFAYLVVMMQFRVSLY
ncbi:Tyrosine-protein phosphatase CDC14-like protein [Frankliniella fusca]|uniref:Gustatory receptor n=1 Tax=Frankliniella fusca TaxID=407009 RepID=A0AAE1I4G4_9NEOP|nr:Tyrosine-protein phosphatase CDC14-like protein [Frankliniella fusca]